MANARLDDTVTLLSDGRVLVTGGIDNTGKTLASAELYDPKTGKFSPAGSMTTTRAFHTATLLSDGRVLIAGGEKKDTGVCASCSTPSLASAELYDPATGKFIPTGLMTTGRFSQTATLLLDGQVLIAGGAKDNSFTASLASAELYDPKTGTFTATGSMANARQNNTATLLSDGRVLIAGSAGCEVYQP
jgi:WD40 repeat protein